MTFENNDNLKECPFCKGEAWLLQVDYPDGDRWYNPQCSNCTAGLLANYETIEEAVEAWNKRG
jgi:hypothetical protein